MGNNNGTSRRSLDDRFSSNTRGIGSHRPRASHEPSSSNITSRELMIADYAIQVSNLQNLFSNKGWNICVPNPDVIDFPMKSEDEVILRSSEIEEIDRKLKANENILSVSFMGTSHSGKSWLINEIFGKDRLNYNNNHFQDNWEVFYYNALRCGFIDTPSVFTTCQNDIILQNILNNLSIAIGSVHIITCNHPNELNAWLKRYYYPIYNICHKNTCEPPSKIFVHIIKREKSNFTNYIHSVLHQFAGKIMQDTNQSVSPPSTTTFTQQPLKGKENPTKNAKNTAFQKGKSANGRPAPPPLLEQSVVEFVIDKQGNRHYFLGHSSFSLNQQTIHSIEMHLISLLSRQSTVTKKNSFQIIKETFYDASYRLLGNLQGESQIFLRKETSCMSTNHPEVSLNIRVTYPVKKLDFSKNCFGCYFTTLQNEELTSPFIGYEFPNQHFVIVIESEECNVTVKRKGKEICVRLASLSIPTQSITHSIPLDIMYDDKHPTIFQSNQVILLIFPFISSSSDDDDDFQI